MSNARWPLGSLCARRLAAGAAAASMLAPAPGFAASPAAPAAGSGPVAEPAAADLAGFEAGFQAGQVLFDAGAYLEAARTWSAAAVKLPETPDHRANRAAIHEYLADAYERALTPEDREGAAQEALARLDRYALEFAAAYPGEAVSERIEAARQRLRARVEAAAAAQVVEAPAPADSPAPAPTPPPGKPWRGLTIAGGVAVGAGAAMLALLVAGAVRARSFERGFDDPARGCSLATPQGDCATLYSDGKAADAMATAGLIAAPVLLGAGVAMLVVGARRKRAATAFTPLLGRGLVGLGWQRRF
jgi:hypothetical protein